LPLLFSSQPVQRDLYSFPTRRSSDLEQITVDDGAGNQVPGMPAYRQIYGVMLRSVGLRGKDLTDTLNELLDQERVAKMAEQWVRSEEHTSELQSRENLVCRLLLEKKK